MLPPWLPVLLALAVQGRDGSPLESGLVRSLDLERANGTWAQHFLLERPGAREDEPPAGLARYVAGPDSEGGFRVELELRYLAQGVTVIHVEQVNPARRRLVFREVRERGGRTLFLEGPCEGGLSGYELGGPEVVHREVAGALLPLFLIETARTGGALPEQADVLDPLAAGVEELRLLQREEREGERVFEARRADGSLRWRLTTLAGELRELRFQERGPLARPVTAEEFEHIRAQHELEAPAAQEAGSPAGASRGAPSRPERGQPAVRGRTQATRPPSGGA